MRFWFSPGKREGSGLDGWRGLEGMSWGLGSEPKCVGMGWCAPNARCRDRRGPVCYRWHADGRDRSWGGPWRARGWELGARGAGWADGVGGVIGCGARIEGPQCGARVLRAVLAEKDGHSSTKLVLPEKEVPVLIV